MKFNDMQIQTGEGRCYYCARPSRILRRCSVQCRSADAASGHTAATITNDTPAAADTD